MKAERAIFGVTLAFLFMSTLSFMFNLFPVEAEFTKPTAPNDYMFQEATNDELLIGAYYYVWWGVSINPHWPLGYRYTPVLGEYSSGDPEVANQHILWASRYGVDFFTVSWFGSHPWADYPAIDQSLKSGLLNATELPRIRFCLLYESPAIMDRAEMEGANKTETFMEDMLYAASNYFVNPNYLKINGKPVVFLYSLYYLYQKFDYSTAPFEYVRQRLADMNMSIFFVGDAVAASIPDVNSPLLRSMDAVTSYFFEFTTSWQTVLDDMNTYYPQWLSSMDSINVHFIPNAYPGFDDSAFMYGSYRILPRNQSMFRRTIDISRKYIDPHLRILMITSWNEWHESTAIEPAIEWGETYLQKIHTINVPEDYPRIQEAINNANQGDTVFVSSGTYYENVIVNKTVSLIGENRNTTVIDGGGIGRTVYVVADNVTIKGFTIRNSGYGLYDGGIWVNSRNVQVLNNNLANNSWSVGLEYPGIYCVIKDNIISGQEHSYAEGGGILVTNSTGNRIVRNTISCYEAYGIYLNGTGNNIIGNVFTNNLLSSIYVNGNNNVIHHNNFMETSSPVSIAKGANIWDNGYPSGGNFWSNYTGVDNKSGLSQDQLGSDGIGDTAYTIDANNTDRYPLIAPLNMFDAGVWNRTAYNIYLISNSTISNFQLNTLQKTISFKATGPNSTAGFCRVTIPNIIAQELWENNCSILVDGKRVETINWTDIENAYIYFTYQHTQHEIVILQTHTTFLQISTTTGGETNPPSGSHAYLVGEVTSVSAIPYKNYIFDHWLLDGTNIGSNNPIEILMDTNHTLNAIFTPITHNLSISTTTGGTTDPAPGTYTYINGTVVSVTAIPEANYVFDYWELDGVNVGSENPINVPMTANHALHAVFLQVYKLTITATIGGTTTPAPGTYNYTAGTTLNITAIPDIGFSFDYWLLDGKVKTENPIALTMDSNHTLEAYFVDDTPPEISNPMQDPPADNVQICQNVTVWVNVTDHETGVKNVTLWYSINNGTTWTPINMTEIAPNTYQATIPGYDNCTWVIYKIIAYDNAGNNATKNNNGYNYKYQFIPEFPENTLLLCSLLLATITPIIIKKINSKTNLIPISKTKKSKT